MVKRMVWLAILVIFGTAFAEDGESVLSKFGIKVYGRLKADASYDTSRTDDGNFARWVMPEGDKDDDDLFNLTARESRLGLNLTGPGAPSIETSGRVEIDFYEGGSENKSRIMMRHAYIQLDWPDYDMSLLAGQTSDDQWPFVTLR